MCECVYAYVFVACERVSVQYLHNLLAPPLVHVLLGVELYPINGHRLAFDHRHKLEAEQTQKTA